MNIREKIVQYPAASVAVAIVAVLLIAIVGGRIGGNTAMTKEAQTTGLVPSPQAPADQVPPIVDPESQTAYPYLSEEPTYVNGPTSDPDAGDGVYPEVYPLVVNLVQVDGGKVHCKPGLTSLSSTANGAWFTIHGQLVKTWWGGFGLTVAPQGIGIKYHRVAVIVDGDRVAWLPGGTNGSQATLNWVDWTESGASPNTVQFCFAGNNG